MRWILVAMGTYYPLGHIVLNNTCSTTGPLHEAPQFARLL